MQESWSANISYWDHLREISRTAAGQKQVKHKKVGPLKIYVNWFRYLLYKTIPTIQVVPQPCWGYYIVTLSCSQTLNLLLVL